MLVKVNYELSEVRDYTNDADAGHKYLHIVFEPKGMNILLQAALGTRGAQYTLNFYPHRDNDGNIIQEFEDALLDAFEDKSIDKTPVYVSKVEVPIPPTLMKDNEGNYYMDGDIPHVYTSLRLTCIMEMKKDGEVTADPMSQLMRRALAQREYRIQQGQWEPADGEVVELEPNDIDDIPEAPSTPAAPEPVAARPAAPEPVAARPAAPARPTRR